MSEAGDSAERPSVKIANRIIEMANAELGQGASEQEIASGLRHAAANFSAFAFFQNHQLPRDPNAVVEEFTSFFEHYLDRHKPAENPAQGLFSIIDQVKREL